MRRPALPWGLAAPCPGGTATVGEAGRRAVPPPPHPQQTGGVPLRSALDRLFPDQRSVLLDGAMGTSLFAKGWPQNLPTVMANLEAPDWVGAVHRGHRAAGARVLLANTFGALQGADGSEQRDVTRAAVRLALEAASGGAMVAGVLSAHDLAFHGPGLDAVVGVMRDEGCDLLVFETCNSLADARAALDVARRMAPRLPVVVCATTTDGSREDRKRVDEVLAFLVGEGDDQVEPGLNCCRGPYEALRVGLALPSMPRWIKPSTGDPAGPRASTAPASWAAAAAPVTRCSPPWPAPWASSTAAAPPAPAPPAAEPYLPSPKRRSR